MQPITLPALVVKYLESIRPKKSKRYYQDLHAKLKRASKTFTGQIREIRADDIDKWIEDMKDAGERTKNNYREAMLTLFAIAEGQGGFFTAKQAEEAGCDRTHHAYHVRVGNWHRELHMTVPTKFRRMAETPTILALHYNNLSRSQIEVREGYRVT